MGLSDNTVSELWTLSALIDSTLTGALLLLNGRRTVLVGLQVHTLSIVRIVRTCALLQSYRLDGLACEEGPLGVAQTQIIPGTVGKSTIITTDKGLPFSRNSHIPYRHSWSFIDEQVWWPSCGNLDRKPTPYEELAILG